MNQSQQSDKQERARLEWFGLQPVQDYIHREKLIKELAELESDERLTQYRTASCFSNVVLALHQASGRARIDLLRKLLELPPYQYPKGDPE